MVSSGYSAALSFIVRLGNGVMNAINRKRKKDAINAAAESIANGDRVQHSDQTFTDISTRPKRDKSS